MKKSFSVLLFIGFIFNANSSFAWGRIGHKIVAEIAQQNLDKSVNDSVKFYLDTISFEKASTWMDEVRSDHSYDYMKPWHYINIEKDKTYVKSDEKNIVTELEIVIAQLKDRKKKTKEEIATEIKILFHLVGDMEQPLHVGYGEDKGGNSIDVAFLKKKSNLHRVWDSEIIEEKKIALADCVNQKLTPAEKKTTTEIDPVVWMNDSRSLLANVYSFTNETIDQAYIDKNTPVVEKQILKGGLRLAAVLNEVFKK
jgi:hypothetical protein